MTQTRSSRDQQSRSNRHNETNGSSDEELMVRIMEECGELIQATSKMYRFGIHDRHPTYYNGRSNIEEFGREFDQLCNLVGDFLRRVYKEERCVECDNYTVIPPETVCEGCLSY